MGEGSYSDIKSDSVHTHIRPLSKASMGGGGGMTDIKPDFSHMPPTMNLCNVLVLELFH